MIDVGDYCRQVEAYLTRVNGGHLVRVVGPGFELVRHWAESGVPLSAVFRGIEQKAERHRAGRSTRPLRIEFCEADVREVYDAWRRAIGISTSAVGEGTDVSESVDDGASSDPALEKRKSITKSIDRAIERLARTAGRLELSGDFRDALSRIIESLAHVRAEARGARGAARDAIVERLGALDRELVAQARLAVPDESLTEWARDAERDLAPYRSRLADAAWHKAVDVTVDRRLRDALGLPILEWT